MNTRTRLLSLAGLAVALVSVSAWAQPQIIDGGEEQARFTSADTTFYDDEFPVIETRLNGGDTEIIGGPDFEDIFEDETAVTQVVVTIEPPTGESITVTTLSGPTWSEDVSSGNWEATFAMPSPGYELNGSFEVEVEGSSKSDNGTFKLKNTKPTT